MSEFEYYIFLYNIIYIQHVYIIQIHLTQNERISSSCRPKHGVGSKLVQAPQ